MLKERFVYNFADKISFKLKQQLIGRGGINLKKFYFLLLATVLIFSITGCSKLKAMTFQEIYPGNLSEVSKIEIRHGNGELKEITEKSIINPWIDSMKDIVFEPSINQEGQVGYLYNVDIFEEDILTLSFSTTHINDFYYDQNEDVLDKLNSLFNEN